MAAPTRFSRQQLGRLMEISTSIQCECPNHLAQLVERLQAFEAYSRDCESRNDADREIHARLYRATAKVRDELERELEALIKHEQVVLT